MGTITEVARSHGSRRIMPMSPLNQRLLAIAVAIAIPIATPAAQSPADTSHNLSLEQQTKIADAITREAGRPMPGAHFSLAIGNAVPAEEQIAIVDSGSRKILEVVQRGLSQTGSVPARTR